jgi:hypothetical protein
MISPCAKATATFWPRSIVVTMTSSARPAVRTALMTPSAGTSQTAQMPFRSGFWVSIAEATWSACPAKSGPAMPCSATISMFGNCSAIVARKAS